METIYIEHVDDVSSLQPEPCVLALGFFDGVHLGHRKVIASAKKISEKKNLKLAVMTFFPHPKEIFSRDHTKINYLTPMDVKTEIFSNLGVDKVYVIHFTKSFAALSPKEFIKKYLVDLKVAHVVAGFDFTYGFKGLGNMGTIQADGNNTFQVTTVTKMESGGRKISSTLIRELLTKGEVHKISDCLGEFYETRGNIIPFSKAAKSGTVRVEMITAPFFSLPKTGLYEVNVQIGDRIYHGTANVISSTILTLEISGYLLMKQNQEHKIKVKWLDQLREKKNIQITAN